MGTRWDVYPDGKRIGGLKIVERLPGGDTRDSVRYEVACMACGEHSEMSHRYIGARANKHVEGCHSCRTEAAARTRKKKLSGEVALPDPSGAIRAGRHLWWPMLGGNGPRWGGTRGTSQVIGSGASGAAI